MPQSPVMSRSQRMIALLGQLAPHEGYTRSALDGVRFMRANHPLGRTQVLYEPGIVIVCQGRKRGFLADEVYVYDAQHYLVLSVPLPFSTETEASEEEPMLAVSLSLDMLAVADLVLTLDQSGVGPAAAPLGIIATPLGDDLADATLRLLQCLASPLEAEVLGPAIVREISFRVLMGEQGGAIRAALTHQGRFGKVAKALRRIHADYAGTLDVARLAAEAGMSVPAFHVHFKAVTHTSPIQYIKSTRLHQARLLMIRDNLSAQAASASVGYESSSQFNREFKRLFGRTPGDEARDLKHALALLPAQDRAQLALAH